MGQLDNEQKGSTTEGDKLSQAILKALTERFENLQQNLILQSNQEIEKLKAENFRLRREIEELKSQRQQDNQPQQLVKQLAEVLANQLEKELIQQLHQIAQKSTSSLSSVTDISLFSAEVESHLKENADKLVASLDSTLRTMFEALEEDINSYHSALSEQLNRMHSMEKQGELILQNLVERLEQEFYKPPDATQPLPPNRSHLSASNFAVEPSPIAKESKKQVAQPKLGFLLILLSTIALSVHHIVVKIVGTQSSLFSIFPLEGFIQLDLGNSLLLFWVRMVVVLPVIALLAKTLHSSVWTELKKFFATLRYRPLFLLLGSGFCLFVSQVFLYMAIGEINPAIAVTLLFLYPIITIPLTSVLFKSRPTAWGIGAIVTLVLGAILTTSPRIILPASYPALGVGVGMTSGVAFAMYIILMQRGVEKLHHVSISLIQFFIMFVVSSLSLLLPLDVDINLAPTAQAKLIIGGIVLGILTVVGYLFNYFGIKFIKPIHASRIASTTPILTALLVFLLIPDLPIQLQPIQFLGVLLVSLAIFALTNERMRRQPRSSQ